MINYTIQTAADALYNWLSLWHRFTLMHNTQCMDAYYVLLITYVFNMSILYISLMYLRPERVQIVTMNFTAWIAKNCFLKNLTFFNSRSCFKVGNSV